MDPITTLAATNRMRSFWLIRELTSVLVPGLALIAEILAILSSRVTTRASFSAVLDAGQIRFALLVVSVAAAWLVGYVAREFSFRMLVRITDPDLKLDPQPVGDAKDSIIESLYSKVKQWKPSRRYESFRAPQKTTVELRERLLQQYGDEAVTDFLNWHPVLRHGFAEAQTLSDKFRGGGGHMQDTPLNLFGYCKHWLRRNAPDAAVDDTEIEINITVGAFLPAILITPTLRSLVDGPLWSTLITPAVVSVLILLELARSFRRLRGSERWDALQRTFEAWAMDRAEKGTPSPTTPPDPAGP